MHRWLRILTAIFVSLLLVFLVGLVAVSYVFASSVLRSEPVETRPQIDAMEDTALALRYPNAEYETIGLFTSDGLQLHALYHPSKNGAAVILLHGYRSNHTLMLPVANLLVQHGYAVLLFDFRGHGLSEGEEITFGKKEVLDVEAAYQFLTDQPGIDSQRIGLFGNSMGGATAILYAAQKPDIGATAVQSPFASLHDVIWVNTRRSLPTPPILLAPLVELWVQNKLGAAIDSFSPENKIQEISPRPVFIMMGGEDIMTDPRGGQRLIDAAGEPKILWYDEATGHLEFHEKHPETFEMQILSFYAEYLR